MKIKIVYRNYKPLHDIYTSLKIEPPSGVEFVIPKPKKSLRRLYPLYLKFGDNVLARHIIAQAQKYLFDTKVEDPDIEIYHFAQLIPQKTPNRPYIIDFEHVISLANFVELDAAVKDRIYTALAHPLCRGVIPLSQAAKCSLQRLLGEFDEALSQKIQVVYPALPDYFNLFADQAEYTHVSSDPSLLKILFVGNAVYKKGLHELLAAFKQFVSGNQKAELYVISDAPAELRKAYIHPTIKFFDPVFAHQAIIKKFFLPCDLLAIPTHDDTFGMAFLYALSCGTPVLTTKQFATPEIVQEGRTGLFVQSNRLHLEDVPFPNRKTTQEYHRSDITEQLLVEDLIGKIGYFCDNREKLADMGQSAIIDFKPLGKFSIEVRNSKLLSMYTLS
ncbi:MAG: glycosyltransferase family 4 protein [Anaerolineae bacterium]|nr:glycosyltransferase family 4 protein [Anaerolineae bacterium]